MSKRNLILLIIILVVATSAVFSYLSFRSPNNPTIEDTGGTNFFSNLNPFGRRTSTTQEPTPPADVSGYVPEDLPLGAQYGKLKKVSNTEVAGYGLFLKERYKEVTLAPQAAETTATPAASLTAPATEFVPAVRYVARANGNIYQTFADKLEERKFSTTVIPKVHEAFFGNKGEAVVMRYLKTDDQTIATYVGALPKEVLGGDSTGGNEVRGSFLPDNITDLSVSPETTRIFYLFNSGENAIGTTAGILGDSKTQVFNSPYTEWLSWWPNSKMITLTTKPSANVPGYMYAIDPSRRNLDKILGNINGLTTLASPDGRTVLYGDNNLSLYMYNLETREAVIVGVRTLPEKCAWDASGDSLYCAVPKYIDQASYPDGWYQGQVSFSDQIWKIDAFTGNTVMVLDPLTAENGEDIDGIKLAVDEQENYLFFVNKKDSTLWEFNLK